MSMKPSVLLSAPFSVVYSLNLQIKNWRRRHKNSQQRLKPIAQVTLMQNMVEGVVLIDPSNRIVEVNPAALKIMVLKQTTDVLGEPIDKVFDFWNDIQDPVQPLQKINSEVSIERDGQVTYYDLHITPLITDQNECVGRLITLHDITERVLLMQELQKIADLDPLLGLYNRRHFYELATREFERARRYHHPLSILMLDLDHFKQVNDYHGHLIGDQALLGFSNILKQSLRSADVVARFGGDEFIILLPETDILHAKQMAERLRANLKETPIDSDAGSLHLTFSGGISSLDGIEESIEALFERADWALYYSKSLGRDRVTVLGEKN